MTQLLQPGVSRLMAASDCYGGFYCGTKSYVSWKTLGNGRVLTLAYKMKTRPRCFIVVGTV
jgi:hypothetical protein